MKFPKELYIVEETDLEGDGDMVLLCGRDITELATPDMQRPVAKYIRAETGKLVNETRYVLEKWDEEEDV